VQFAVSGAENQRSEANAISVSNVPAQDNHWLFLAIAILATAGIVVSSISLQRHYAKSESTFCEFGEKFNCDIVNRSEYSSVMGIPVAGIGIAGYGILLALATVYRSRAETPLRLLAAAGAGLGFALYLTYVEGFVLGTWCILCLSSLALIALITVLAGVVKTRA
jgi:vitamin-K-epoxide reductase (warfarin-sensitive)